MLISDSHKSLSHQVATRWYRPPELLFASRSYSFSADVWSAAAVIAELMTLTPLFPGNNDIDQMFRVFQIMGSPSPERWPGVELLPDYGKVSFPDMVPLDLHLLLPHAQPQDVSFLQTILRLDPASRATALEARSDEYFLTPPLCSDAGALASLVAKTTSVQGHSQSVAGGGAVEAASDEAKLSCADGGGGDGSAQDDRVSRMLDTLFLPSHS